MPNKTTLVIIGASGHGKVIASIAQTLGYKEIVFLDDDPHVKTCLHYEVVGCVANFSTYIPQASFMVAIGNPVIRKKIQTELVLQNAKLATLVHPQAVVAPNVTLGDGTVVMAGAVINTNTQIGQGCIINTCASVDHDCVIEDYVHIAVGAHVAGTVHIGANTWVGMGANIINNLSVCANCMIGAGAVVVKDVQTSGTYFGVPAKIKRHIA